MDLPPSELVAALQRGAAEARPQLERLCRPLFTSLAKKLIERYSLQASPEQLVIRVLRLAEMHLLSIPPATVHGWSSRLLARYLEVRAARPFALRGRQAPLPPAQPAPRRGSRRHGACEIQEFSRPCEYVSGDWLCIETRGPEEVWLLVADVTGHGPAAHLIQQGLPALWELCLRPGQAAPGEVLNALDRRLASVRPDDVFVEAAIARIDSRRRITLAGAGNCRLLFRPERNAPPSLAVFGGPYLGMALGLPRTIVRRMLVPGGELVLATDGLFEHPTGQDGRLERDLLVRLLSLPDEAPLMEQVVQVLAGLWNAGVAQTDDVTMVSTSLVS